MELVGPISDVIKCIALPFKRYIDQHRKLEENVKDLRSRVDDLNIRKQDLELTKEAEIRRRKVVKGEVENWSQNVRSVNAEVDQIEEKFRAVSYFSRARLGKRVCRKIEEVEKIYQKGSFPEGVAVDGPPPAGVTILTNNLEGEIDVKQQIWEYLMGDEVGVIGVCGMGGIGKATIMKHINNQLLREDTFNNVIWATASKELNIFKLQEDIANSMHVSLPTDVFERATRLMNILEERRFVLILDDVWQRFSLLDVGIPEPTSRSSRWKNVLRNHELEYHILNLIVEQCGGLPLAIVTIASSLKGEDDPCVWRNALNELKEHVKSLKESDTEIFECLKLSYDRLGDAEIQSCFLYCSLYPEGYAIGRDKLIENWIDEGLLDGFKTRQAMYDRGHSIINKLQNNCLLERDMGKTLKMHDVLRDMALYIKSEGPQFMVKAGMQLEELPDEQEWPVNLDKVSLMHNSISGAIPAHIKPGCPHLSTLLFQGNLGLTSIPSSFFKHMPGVKVVNLSATKIRVLPKSISKLKNLVALILTDCRELTYVPSLVKLRGLRKLDLFRTRIKKVPHGIDMLENLTYLRLFSWNLKRLPVGILAKMSDHLQCLVMGLWYLNGEEVGELRKLETVFCSFFDLKQFETYAKCIQGEWPTNFLFTVGYLSLQQKLQLRLSTDLEMLQRNVEFVKCEMEKVDHKVVPTELATLCIKECGNFKSLSNIPWFQNATELKRCKIGNCKGIECVVDLSLSSCNALQSIQELLLQDLDNLIELVKGRARAVAAVVVESTSQYAPTPTAIFSSLKQLELKRCSRIKKLFPIKLLQGLQNLEKILVSKCEKLEDIIASEEEDEENNEGEGTTVIDIIASEEEDEENDEGEGTTVILPKLESFFLTSLPELKSICSSRVTIQADSLRHLRILECAELKRIPLALPLSDNREPSPPPSLETIEVSSSEWWESLEWDQPYAKDVLSPFSSDRP